MRKTSSISLLFCLLLSFVSDVHAQLNRFTGYEQGDMGISGFVGQPVMARFNYWSDWKRQWNFGLGYDLENFISAEANYAFYRYDARDIWKKKQTSNVFLFKYGPGAFFSYRALGGGGGSPLRGGVRAFTGLDYVLGGSRWALSAEIGANANMIGDSLFSFRGMVGATFHFDSNDSRKKRDRVDEFNDVSDSVEEEFQSEPPPRRQKRPIPARPAKRARPKPVRRPDPPPSPAPARARPKPQAKPRKKPPTQRSDEWEGEKWNEKDAIDAKEVEEFF